MKHSRVLLSFYWWRASLPIALFYAIFSLSLTVSAENCGKPFSMPVTNVALNNGNHMRGVQIAIGSSEQPLAMIPSTLTNNTLIYDSQGQCDKSFTQAKCSTYRGGMFDTSNSTTYEAVSSMSASGADPSDTYVNATSDLWSTDTFHYTSNISSEVAFGIRRANTGGDYLTQHILGLGANSTLLSTLKRDGIVASRSWSMYWGNSGAPETQNDGVFVFGGYDKTKITGTNYSFPLTYDSHCLSGMVVSLSDISLTFPNGTKADLFDSASNLLRACIMPDYPVLMTLPRDPYYQNLQLAVGISNVLEQHSFGLNFYGETYSSDYDLDFGMSISLQSGPSISIANSQVVQPDATILANGSINYSSTLNEVNIIPLQSLNANDMVQLGRQFLSGAYLLVNEDAGTFTLWQATDSSDEELVAVDENGKVFSPVCASTKPDDTTVTSTGSTESASSSSSTSLSSSPTSSSKNSTSSIIGPVVGGVAGVVLLMGLGIFLWMRKSKNKAANTTSDNTNIHGADEKAIPLSNYTATERDSSTHELWGNPLNEMSGHITPKEKTKHSTSVSGVYELGDSR